MYMRLNLLPTRYSRKRTGTLYELILMISVVVATLLGLYFWYWMTNREINQLMADTSNVRQQIEKLKKEVVRVDEFKKKARALEDKLKVIDTLKDRKSGPVRLLEDLATVVTQVGDVWIEEISEKNDIMTLNMSSLRSDKISEFMEQLETHSRYFEDVDLVVSEAKQEKNLTYHKFKVKCEVRYYMPEES